MLKKYIASAILISLLTACSSGSKNDTPTSSSPKLDKQTENMGSQGNTNNQTGNTNATNTNPTGNANAGNSNSTGNQPGNESSTSSNVKAKIGANYFFTKDGSEGHFQSVSSYDELEVDGKKLSLVAKLEQPRKEQKLEHSSFGVYFARGMDEDYVVSRGELTPESQMPTSMTATYRGNAFYGSKELGEWVDGSSEFAVDFGKKTVDGTVKVPSLNINLQFPTATIRGNTFSAHIDKSDEDRDFVKGSFYGKNAAELGGMGEIEKNGKAGFAVFGAKKVK